ncbi:MAG TPA: 50S ribosomal protein L4 [Symbiobacteriaceae bacterium]|jgi:large subunit ribosomal protein L4
MPKVAVYNKEGATVGEITLSDAIFGAEVNPGLMHEVVQMYLANQRQGTSDTKTRAQVSGGGRKPWKQKGTGRARQGSTRSPQWRHGGVVFGPHPRPFGWSMPKKARRLALRGALSSKLAAGDLIVLDTFELEAPKTKEVAGLLQKLNVSGKAYLVLAGENVNVYKSARNIPGVNCNVARNLNVYEVLNAGKLVLTRDAVAKVEEVLG